MTPLTAAQIIDAIIEKEGGYVDHPADRGGPTNFGITLAKLKEWRDNPAVTTGDLRHMRRGEAALIYHKDYIEKPGFRHISHDLLRHQVVDFGVNSGPGTAARKLQKVLGVKEDGHVGPVTLAAIRRMGPAKANNLLMAERIKFLGKIVHDDPTQAVFINGWLNRALEFMI